MIAGVVMNVVLAVVVAIGLVFHYGQYDYPGTIGGVQPPASAPQLSELQTGDTIRAVNGVAVKTWSEVQKQIRASTKEVALTTQRGEVKVPVGSGGASAADVADGLVFFLPPVIDTAIAGDRAAEAGFKSGDSIVSVAGHPVRSWTDMVEQVEKSAEKPLTFVFRRGAATDTLVVTPRLATVRNPVTGKEETVGRIGAAAKNPAVRVPVKFGSAVTQGFALTASNAGAVFKILKQIGTGATSVRELGGPLAITRASVTAASCGLDALFDLIALLSINVAVLNLLPIPILDGGQILINVLESAKGSPFSLKTRDYILRFGLVAIALLFAIVMYNDTRAGFAKLFGWLGKALGA
jgi:regulator of sigma E protease